MAQVAEKLWTPTDFDRKLPDYQRIPSMRDILLVSSRERRVRH
jgi:hypothetical protein